MIPSRPLNAAAASTSHEKILTADPELFKPQEADTEIHGFRFSNPRLRPGKRSETSSSMELDHQRQRTMINPEEQSSRLRWKANDHDDEPDLTLSLNIRTWKHKRPKIWEDEKDEVDCNLSLSLLTASSLMVQGKSSRHRDARGSSQMSAH